MESLKQDIFKEYINQFKDEQPLKLACLYAYCGNTNPFQIHYILECYKRHNRLVQKEFDKFTKLLIEKEAITQKYSFFYSREYKINGRHWLLLYQYLFNERPEWLQEFRDYFENRKQKSITENFHLIMTGEATQKLCIHLDDILLDALLSTLGIGDFYKITTHLDENDMLIFARHCINLMCVHDIPNIYESFNQIVQEQKKTNDKSQKFLNMLEEMASLMKYYAYGTPITGKNPKSPYGMIVKAINSAYHRDYQEAEDCFIKLNKERNKLRNSRQAEKNIPEDMIEAYVNVFLYCVAPTEKNEKSANALLKKKVMDLEWMMPAKWLLLNSISTQGMQNMIPSEKYNQAKGIRALNRIIYLHINKDETNSPYKNDEMPKLNILKHELSAFIPIKEKEELNQCYEGAPLLESLKQKEPWEKVLEKLYQTDLEETQKRNKRLIYIINKQFNNDYITIREQTLSKNGEWGKGRVVSESKFLYDMNSELEEEDMEIRNVFNHSEDYCLRKINILPYLIESDRVFFIQNNEMKPIRVTEEKPFFIIQEDKKNNITITANYMLQKSNNKYENEQLVLEQKSDTEYVVYKFKSKQKKIFDQILEIGTFPQASKERLQEFFKKTGKHIEVKSTIEDMGTELKEIRGESDIILQVTPEEECFHITFKVRPLKEGKETFIPGKGVATYVDKNKEGQFKVKRKLKEESGKCSEITEYLEENCNAIILENQTSLGLPEMLQLMEYISENPNMPYIEWPENRELKIKKANKSKLWDIRMTSRNNWFELEGNAIIDEDTVLHIEKLLDLFADSKSKYVKLNDKEFLILNDNLKKQLEKLESLSVKVNGKVKINKFHVGIMEDGLLNGAMSIKGDELFENIRQKVIESNNLEAKVPKQLKAQLREYQRDGFKWIAKLNSWGAGACLADDMGLGKTLQSIAYLLYTGKNGASLIVAPTSVIPNWIKELQRFAPLLNVKVLNNSNNRKEMVNNSKKMDVIITSFGLLVSEKDILTTKKWNVICIDEAHTIKNRTTKTSQAAMQLQSDNKLILTGTPVQNHLGELWNLYQFINPGLLGSYEQFTKKYILPIEVEHDKERQKQLNKIIHPFMLRRTKQEVVEELPDKEEIILPIELTEEEMAVYELNRRKAEMMLLEEGEKVTTNTLKQITKLRQLACCTALVEKNWKGDSSKINKLMELLEELKEGGNRALVFSQFTSFFKIICQKLKKMGEKYIYLDGSTPMKQREKLVEEFQEGNCPFFFISLKAGGLGLNLTEANYVIHLDPWWNPSIEQQATDRAYRIGQTQKVTAYHLISNNTIEQKIIDLHKNKRNLADALLEGTDMNHKITAQELMEIVSKSNG